MFLMKKILPIDINPIIKTYGAVGSYLGILNASGFNTNGILLNHYIDLFYAKKSVGFTELDYIRNKKFERRDFLFSESNIISKVKSEINNNHYVLLILNELFVDNSKIHRDYSYCHDWLVYGYDDERSVFKVVGYYGSDKLPRVYGTVDITYTDLRNGAFNALKEKHIYKNTSLDNNVLWIKKTNIEEQVNLQILKNKLRRYLRGQILLYNKQPFIFAGTNVINMLIRYHKRKANNIYFDVRNYRFCLENKKVILLALKSYSDDFDLIQKYECAVVNCMEKVLLLSVKYIIKPDYRINDRVVELLVSAQKTEKDVLGKFLKSI